MAAGQFEHLETRWGDVGSAMASACDMLVVEIDGHAVLYTVTPPGGAGLVAWDISGAGAPVELARRPLPGPAMAGVQPELSLVESGERPLLLVTGAGGDSGVVSVPLDGAARPGGVTAWGARDLTGVLAHLAEIEVGGRTMVFGSDAGTGALAAVTLGEDGSPASVAAVTTLGAAPTALAGFTAGGSTHLLVATAGDVTLASYLVRADGSLVPAGSLDRVGGPGIEGPSVLRTVTVDGTDYAIVGGTVSGTLSVFAVAADGTLTLTDHLIDSRDTRFDGVSEIAVASTPDGAWVVAAGADSGLSLFRLLPGGSLLHVESIEDDPGTALDGVGGLALEVQDGALELFAVSSGEYGLGRFRIDLADGATLRASDAGGPVSGSAGSDLLWGGEGDDVLAGQGGADLLHDGAGQDVLKGGTGADLFILADDGTSDRIDDFQAGADRIDVSRWPFLRDESQLQLIPRANGGELRFGDEVLHLVSADGASLSVEAMRQALIWGPSRMLPDWVERLVAEEQAASPQESGPTADDGTAGDPGASGPGSFHATPRADAFQGGEDDDVVEGLGGDDDLRGGGGNDRLDGGGGADQLRGEAGDDILFGGDGSDELRGQEGADKIWGDEGHDRIWGHDGADKLRGDIGWDELHGGGGDDQIWGNDGRDRIWGDDGNDELWGNDGVDEIRGGDGDDMLYGGRGPDTLIGDAGNDQLWGHNYHDVMKGLAGDDWMDGGQGNDQLYGGDGADDLDGGASADRIWGDDGADRLNGSGGDDELWGGAGDDLLLGGRRHDVLDGGAGQDRLEGEQGDDRLFGGAGNDILDGGGGEDRLDGGAGDDVLTGGAHADVFVFTGGDDRILDFQDDGDRLLLDPALWSGNALTRQDVLDTYGHQAGGDVVLDFGAAGSLTVEDMTLKGLTDEFGFL